MPYVVRDDDGGVVGAFIEPVDSAREYLPCEHPEVCHFIARVAGFDRGDPACDTAATRGGQASGDRLDTLVRILLERRLIQSTDFPPSENFAGWREAPDRTVGFLLVDDDPLL